MSKTSHSVGFVARPQAEQDWLGHAVSSDLINWEELPLALGPNSPGTLDDLQPWTGCAVEKEGTFYLYYTMRGSAERALGQRIGLATSTDLMSWQRYGHNPVIEPDPRWYVGHADPIPRGIPDSEGDVPGMVDSRDMVIVPDTEGNGW